MRYGSLGDVWLFSRRDGSLGGEMAVEEEMALRDSSWLFRRPDGSTSRKVR
jgi:hypothetical protein